MCLYSGPSPHLPPPLPLAGGDGWLGRCVEVRLFVSPYPLLPYGAPSAPQEDKVRINNLPSDSLASLALFPRSAGAQGVGG